MSDRVNIVEVRVPQLIEVVEMYVPQPIEVIEVRTGIRGPQGAQGPKGEGGDIVRTVQNGGGIDLVIGMPIAFIGPDRVILAVADGGAASWVNGIVTADRIVPGAYGQIQLVGVLHLTISQWLGVTDTAGLIPQEFYFVSGPDALTPLTITVPTTGAAPCVGKALTATDLLIECSTILL